MTPNRKPLIDRIPRPDGLRQGGLDGAGGGLPPINRVPRPDGLLLVLSLCTIGGLLGCDARPELPAVEQSVRPARVVVVETPNRLIEHELVARVQAAQSVNMTFEVAGVLAELPVREGQTLERGDLVAALDPTDFRLAVREAEVQLQLAHQDLERKRKMLEQRGIAASLVDDARSEHELRKVRLAQRREALAKSRLTAPFDAYVAQRYLDNFARVGTQNAVVRLNDLHELLVVVSLPERLLATISSEQVASIEAVFPFAPARRFPLVYRENQGEADAVAQTYKVSFAMQRPSQLNVLPGMTAAVFVKLRQAPGVRARPQIPVSALVSGPNKDLFVWLYDPDTALVRRQAVQVAPPTAAGIPVLTGLSGGELVVASGAAGLQEGMRIRPLAAAAEKF